MLRQGWGKHRLLTLSGSGLKAVYTTGIFDRCHGLQLSLGRIIFCKQPSIDMPCGNEWMDGSSRVFPNTWNRRGGLLTISVVKRSLAPTGATWSTSGTTATRSRTRRRWTSRPSWSQCSSSCAAPCCCCSTTSTTTWVRTHRMLHPCCNFTVFQLGFTKQRASCVGC